MQEEKQRPLRQQNHIFQTFSHFEERMIQLHRPTISYLICCTPLILYAITLLSPHTATGQDQDEKTPQSDRVLLPEIQRDWTEAGEQGRKIHGTLTRINPHNVLIRLPNVDKEKIVKKSQLSKLDLAYLEILPSVHSDSEQYSQTESIWGSMHSGTFPSVDQVREYQVRFPKSPYGLLLSGIATACTSPDYELAESYFEKAHKAISTREKILPDLMPATLVTCWNNYAIVLWRQGKGNLAVRLLNEASSIGPKPAEFLIHNAKIIMSENENRVEKYQVPKKMYPVLEELAQKPYERAATQLRSGVMYFSLNVDSPPPLNVLDELLRLHFDGEETVTERYTLDPVFANLMQSKNCAYEPWCTTCDGKGVFRCPNRCNRGVIAVPIQTLEARGIRGEPVYGTRFVDKRCDVCNGKGVGDECNKCNGTGRNNPKNGY